MDNNYDDLASVIEGCRRKDRDSQRHLYQRYYGWALRTVYRYIGSYEQTREVVHKTFVRLFHSFGQFLQKEEAGVEAMLLHWMREGFVRSAVQWVQAHSGPDDGGEGDNMSQPDDFTDQSPTGNPAEAALHRELMIRLVMIPAKLRLVFNLLVIDSYAPAQAAELLRIRNRRMERYLSQARFLLRLPFPDR